MSSVFMYCMRTREEILARARHPYTQGLLRAIPSLGRRGERLAEIPGVVPPPQYPIEVWQALEQKGDPQGALRHYQAILRVEPRHRTVRERVKRLAQELGVVLRLPGWLDDIRPALEEGFAADAPVCINVMTDPKPISPGSIALAMIGGVDVSKFFKKDA